MYDHRTTEPPDFYKTLTRVSHVRPYYMGHIYYISIGFFGGTGGICFKLLFYWVLHDHRTDHRTDHRDFSVVIF